jgi:hypothetical protein
MRPIVPERGAALVTMLFLMLALLMMSLSAHAPRSRTRNPRATNATAKWRTRRPRRRCSTPNATSTARPAPARRAPPFLRRWTPTLLRSAAPARPRRRDCAKPRPLTAAPAWQAADLAGTAGVEYGRFTKRTLPTGAGTLPAAAPRYLVELLPGPLPLFRITALGVGADPATIVVLQSHYRRTTGSAPGKRLGWREIANWPALHRAAS